MTDAELPTGTGRGTPLPARVGKYEVVRELGRGAMGVVYEARDPSIDRPVAIKTIHAHLLDAAGEGNNWLARFRREATAAARCLHPNIVAIFELGDDAGVPFLVMEYVVGTDLKGLIQDQVPFALPEALSIAGQLLDALGYAHARGIVHRDIKPGNLIVQASGLIKVADFGIARIGSVSLTQPGSVVGTPTHMAPEMFTGGVVDLRSDLFSAGVVLYQLVAGTRPFAGASIPDLMYQIAHAEPADPRTHNPAIPEALAKTILRALSKKPEHRHRDAAEFNLDLGRCGVTAAADHPSARATRLISRAAARETSVAATAASHTSATAGPTLAGTGAFEEATLSAVARDLAIVVGPMARVLVARAASQATTLEQLYEQIARHIPDEAHRRAFFEKARLTRAELVRVQSAAATTQLSQTARFDDDLLEQVTKDLAPHTGPVARVLVRKAARDCPSIAALYERLSQHIDVAVERAAFLDKVPRGQ